MKKLKKMIVLGMVVLFFDVCSYFFSRSLPVMFQIQLSTLVREVTTEVLRAEYLFGVRRERLYICLVRKQERASGGSLSAWVQRTNNKNTSSVKTVDRYYGSWSY